KVLRTGVRRKRVGRVAGRAVLALESRELLSATTGLVWDNAAALTLSFAPDGTDVSGQSSDLYSALAPLGDVKIWQKAILNAVQGWVVKANLNVGVVSDTGAPLGAGGPFQGDTRFGDIRIAGAQMSPDVLALSIPADGMLAGTWSGDIVLNTAVTLNSLDELSVIASHEIGHVLGLEENANPDSPLYSNLTPGSVATPTADDIAALRQLYGTRLADRNDRSHSNETPQSATKLRLPDSFDGSTPLISFGDITRIGDVDYLAVPNLAGYVGPRTFEVRTGGISLLNARLTVVDLKGNVVGRATSTGAAGETLSVQVTQSDANTRYLVRIESATSDSYGIGSYTLVAKFDDRLTADDAVIDSVARGRFDYLSANQLQEFLRTGQLPDLEDEDESESEVRTNASGILTKELEPTEGFSPFTRYDSTGTVTANRPVTEFVVKSPNSSDTAETVLTITVRAVEQNGIQPFVTLLDDDGEIVPTRVITNGLGVYTIQATGVTSGREYTARVESRSNSAGPLPGNYVFAARFGSHAIQLEQFAAGTLTAEQSTRLYQLDVAQTQLFHFELASASVPTGDAIALQYTVFDATGREVYRLVGLAGETRTASSVLLSQGSYLVRVNAVARDGGSIPTIAFEIGGCGISEPIGPILSDPTGTLPSGSNPGTRQPAYTWTTTVTIATPVAVAASRPNPWQTVPTSKPLITWYWYAGIPTP
ncbi:MAG: matrixin family metalloprotease, partial [Planctomycetota bacterium]|nr:matrixin family metalloprotease [Planctomycetota bacterium]